MSISVAMLPGVRKSPWEKSWEKLRAVLSARIRAESGTEFFQVLVPRTVSAESSSGDAIASKRRLTGCTNAPVRTVRPCSPCTSAGGQETSQGSHRRQMHTRHVVTLIRHRRPRTECCLPAFAWVGYLLTVLMSCPLFWVSVFGLSSTSSADRSESQTARLLVPAQGSGQAPALISGGPWAKARARATALEMAQTGSIPSHSLEQPANLATVFLTLEIFPNQLVT